MNAHAIDTRRPIERLLPLLEGVRANGPDAWVAKCPAHEDRSPSLSVRQNSDGTLLIHDFGGCEPGEILAAVGLEIGDLFPPRLQAATPAERRANRQAFQRASWAAALGTVRREMLIVQIAAHEIIDGHKIGTSDFLRLTLAAARLDEAAEALRA